MDNPQNVVPSHFGLPALTSQGELNTRTTLSPVQYRVEFVNNLGAPVSVLMRNGLKFNMDSEPSFTHRTFTIRVFITINSSAYGSIVDSLRAAAAGDAPELAVLSQAFGISVEGNMWRGGTLTLDYDLTLEQLYDLGGTVYYHEVDYVVSLETNHAHLHHPHSEQGRKNQVLVECPLFNDRFERETGGTPIGFGYSITMVNNDGKKQVRYINIANQVYRITPTVDLTKKDGIYIVSNHSMSNKGGRGGFESRWYDFENAEETLGLWKTPEEARHGGDKSILAKENLARAQAEVERLRAERSVLDEQNAIEKAQLEATMREHEVRMEKEREEIARERAEREYEEKVRRQKLADHYEEKSYVRKDTSEGLKFLPSLLIGLGALFSVLKLSS